MAVGLQAGHLFGHPNRTNFVTPDRHAEGSQGVEQRGTVVGNVGGETLKRLVGI